MSDYILEAVIGFIVWSVANVVYLDMVRGGTRGFRRLVAFWMGTPTTILTLLFVRRENRVAFEPPPDDDQQLLEEIRRDRRTRALGEARETTEEEA